MKRLTEYNGDELKIVAMFIGDFDYGDTVITVYDDGAVCELYPDGDTAYSNVDVALYAGESMREIIESGKKKVTSESCKLIRLL